MLEHLVSDEEWEQLEVMGLLRPQEKTYLSQLEDPQHTIQLLYWASDVVRQGMEERKTLNALKFVADPMLDLSFEQQDLGAVMQLPIPFPYYHLLNVMVLMNLVLWGYAMAISQSIFGTLIYIMASIIFLGMMKLGNQLADPFGDDEVDFPLGDWVDDLLVTSKIVLNGDYFGNENHTWEEALEAQRSMAIKPPPRHSFQIHSSHILDKHTAVSSRPLRSNESYTRVLTKWDI